MGRSSSVVDGIDNDVVGVVALNTTRLAPRNSTLFVSFCCCAVDVVANASSRLDDDDDDTLGAFSDDGDMLDDENVTLF